MNIRYIANFFWLFAVLLFLNIDNLVSQTKFAAAEPHKDFSRYDFVERCLVAIDRLEKEEVAKRGVRQDTSAFTPSELTANLSEKTVEFAKGCSARWTSIPIPMVRNDTSFYGIARVLLNANRDAEVVDGIKRLISERSQIHDSTFIWSWGETFLFLWRVRPYRFDLFDMIVQETYERRDKIVGLDRMLSWYALNWYQLLNVYRRLSEENEQATILASKILELNDNLTAEDKDNIEWIKSGGPIFTLSALKYLNYSASLDSLKKGTDAYLKLHASQVERAVGTGSFRSRIGTTAPKIRHDFLFKSLLSSELSANENELSKSKLIVFLGHDCYQEVPPWRNGIRGRTRSCYSTYAAIRRLKEQFPDLPIIAVSQTRGFFGGLTPPQPEAEALKLKELWLDFHRLPVDLVVEVTPHWFLDGYDRRRIDDLTENYINWSGNGSFSTKLSTAVLVDSDGIILHSTGLDERFNEVLMGDMLKALKERER